MSTPAITNKLFQLKKRRSREATSPTDPEILALLNQIDLGAQNGATTVPGIPTGNRGVVDPGQVRPVR